MSCGDTFLKSILLRAKHTMLAYEVGNAFKDYFFKYFKKTCKQGDGFKIICLNGVSLFGN